MAHAADDQRRTALSAVAKNLRHNAASIAAANRQDVAAGQAAGLSDAMLDRLRLTDARIEGMAQAIDEIAAMPDPLGQVTAREEERRRPNGLLVAKRRIPLGVIAVIYESRPNVTTDAFALCLRAGNAVILRGGKEAIASCRALGNVIAAGLEQAGLPPFAAQVVPFVDRDGVLALLKHNREIDLVIPRGGEGLIRFVDEHSRIPVIKHEKGVCHVYVDEDADLDMALAICENAKVSRPSACNACETILVHQNVAATFVAQAVARLVDKGVEVRGDATVQKLADKVVPAQDSDWSQEYLALIVAMRVVPSLDAAIEHIQTYGSEHTEAIVTRNVAHADAFVARVNSSTVLVNASTRFADGGELGLGAEIGISTSKLHAFGPMGARELTTTKFVVMGNGQTRT